MQIKHDVCLYCVCYKKLNRNKHHCMSQYTILTIRPARSSFCPCREDL